MMDIDDTEIRQREIERLEKQRMKDIDLAMHAYARVKKAAGYTSFITLVLTSFTLHSLLLNSEMDIAAHLLAFVINLSLSFVAYKLVREFHPLRRRGAEHWQASKKTRYQISRMR